MSETAATRAAIPDETPVFSVPWLNALGSRLLARHRRAFVSLARMETNFLGSAIAEIDVSRPIFVCGLARSGTTVVLELLARHHETASQRYLDYPFVFTPYWWNRYLGLARRTPGEPAERAHRDRLMVSAESPEAMEEPLWMHFFPGTHDAAVRNVLTEETDNAAFEAFYRCHMAKLLAVRDRTRYLAKGNYHIARMRYLHHMFPGASFVVPVRDPVAHIASSMKQHALFTQGQQQSAEARLYLAQIGHFEFGLDRSPINVDAEKTAEILALWEAGDEIGGWAYYWAAVHGHIADTLDKSPELAGRVMVIEYEKLCLDPGAHAHRLIAHCGLADDEACRRWAQINIGAKRYYGSGFSQDDVRRIRAITRPALNRLEKHAAVI